MENRIKMDDLGVPLFLETPITVWEDTMIVVFQPTSLDQRDATLLVQPRSGEAMNLKRDPPSTPEPRKKPWNDIPLNPGCLIGIPIINSRLHMNG